VFRDQLLEIEPIWKEKKTDQVRLADFEIIKCIGTGGFSRVFLTRLKATGVFYALKLMEKEGLFESGKECVVSNERNIMVELKSPYIVNLEFAFETKHFVALALECTSACTQTVPAASCSTTCGRCGR
jgi:serine/threonine protein kinase